MIDIIGYNGRGDISRGFRVIVDEPGPDFRILATIEVWTVADGNLMYNFGCGMAVVDLSTVPRRDQ